MAQPTAYNRQTSFTAYQQASPSAPLSGASVDAEFNAVKVTLDEIRVNLALIQRDDGDLANETVGQDQLATEVSTGVAPAETWATATAYAVNDAVFMTDAFYRCLVAHTSETFSTDLAAEKWVLYADLGPSIEAAVGALGGMLASVYDPQTIEDDAFDRANHTGAQALSTISDAGTAAAADIDTDTALTADSDTRVPSQKAVKAYAQPLDSDLTAIAALSPSNDDVVQRKSGAWTNRTAAQYLADLGALGKFPFPATQVPSAGANDLDDYEEGTWTPSVSGSGGGSGVNVTATGTYRKIGSFVAVWLTVTLTDVGTLTGNLQTTLPFSQSGTDLGGGVAREVSGTGNTYSANIQGTTLSIFRYDNSGTTFTNGYLFRIRGFYTV